MCYCLSTNILNCINIILTNNELNKYIKLRIVYNLNSSYEITHKDFITVDYYLLTSLKQLEAMNNFVHMDLNKSDQIKVSQKLKHS